MAVPVFKGAKTEGERFPGAVDTLCIEAMVQDRKAIQAGTSHFLGQNFSRSSGINFLSRDNKQEFAWTTSWGVSTRLVGTLIMMHADDDGMVIPPRLAPTHVVILPITPKPDTRDAVLKAARELADQLRAQSFDGSPIEVEVDARDLAGGTKSWEWVKKGVPVRLELGPRDLEKGTVALYRRDRAVKEKTFPVVTEVVSQLPALLAEIQDSLYAKALALRDANTIQIDSQQAFYDFFTPKNADKPEIHGGFALAHFSGSREVEEKLKTELKVTVRCIPRDIAAEPGTCIFTGQPSPQRVIFAKAY
jgi:prolyl-tRNA synthetase